VDRIWRRENIITVRDMPGVPSKWHFQCHRLAEPYLREGFRRGQIACPDYIIERAACFVFRHIRHDPTRPLSLHSWAICVDIDPWRNRGKYFERGLAPPPFSGKWRQIWPEGLPEAFVEAFKSAGFTWGGDWDSDGLASDHEYVDPMHFELYHRGILLGDEDTIPERRLSQM
jgi:hypothetical protein